MIIYSAALVVFKPVEDVLMLLPHYYYNKDPQLESGIVYGYKYIRSNIFFSIETTLSISQAGGQAVMSMRTVLKEKFLFLRLVLPLVKPVLAARQVYDLSYLKNKLEQVY